jgi:hypothetical protein
VDTPYYIGGEVDEKFKVRKILISGTQNRALCPGFAAGSLLTWGKTSSLLIAEPKKRWGMNDWRFSTSDGPGSVAALASLRQLAGDSFVSVNRLGVDLLGGRR